jgi:hypothetical protein
MKTDILENLKKRTSIRVGAMASNLRNYSSAISNALGYQKAQSFLEILIHLSFTQLYMLKLKLSLFTDKEYYQSLAKKADLINLAKRREEIIDLRRVI